MKTDLVVQGTAETINVDLFNNMLDSWLDKETADTVRGYLYLCSTTHIESYILPGYLADNPQMVHYAEDHVKRMIGSSVSKTLRIQFDNHPHTDV